MGLASGLVLLLFLNKRQRDDAFLKFRMLKFHSSQFFLTDIDYEWSLRKKLDLMEEYLKLLINAKGKGEEEIVKLVRRIRATYEKPKNEGKEQERLEVICQLVSDYLMIKHKGLKDMSLELIEESIKLYSVAD